jgi:endo-1,4-beta-D-glucanase Y
MVATPLDSVLERTWSGLKARNIKPWSDGLVHRPKSETPGDAVSEGQAYGMTLALYLNDQAAFNGIWDAAESKMWNDGNGFYDWRWNNGTVVGMGLATDADQDIALMLIFADALVEKGIWTAHKSPKNVDYKARAQSILTSLWNKGINDGNLRPGANWGGGGTCGSGASSWPCGDHVNPGYFAPANYRVFKDFDKSRDWGKVIDKSYQTIAKSPGYGKGLLPDWMKLDGTYASAKDLGYNPFDVGQSFYKDAIRVHWRLATDWLWFKEPRAKTFLDNAYGFVGRNPSKANFYRMDGSLVPAESTFVLNGTKGPTRSRREHSALTTGMWACAAMASGGADSADSWAREMLRWYAPGSDVWGLAKDPDGGVEDTAHNEVYFDQFLAWFGASILAGRFTNILADLSASDAATALAWKTAPTLDRSRLVAESLSLGVSARLTRSMAWAVRIRHKETGAEWSATGISDTISLVWDGRDRDGKLFPLGGIEAIVRVRGLPEEVLPIEMVSESRRNVRIQGVSAVAAPGGLAISGSTPCAVTVRGTDGRVLARKAFQGGVDAIPLAGSGLVLVELSTPERTDVRRVLLRP